MLALTIAWHRADLMDTFQALFLFGVAALLGAVAIVLALIGLVIAWERGFIGARAALLGIVYGTICLSPLAYASIAATTHPAINDISTDWIDPPQFPKLTPGRTGRMNRITLPSADKIQLQKQAYPDLITRRFGIGTVQLFGAARKVVERSNWKIADEKSPKDDTDRAGFEAVARTAVLGAEDDVSIRILPEPTGARIDVRSVSRYGSHDLGQNARRIRAFFTSLDAAVAESFGQ